MSLAINRISFTGNEDNDRNHVRATEVGVAGGATIGGAKYSAEAFKRFKLANTKDFIRLSGETTDAIRKAANTGKQVKSLWGRMFANAKNYKDAIINWAKTTKTAKFLMPVFESKAFAKVSGAIGGVTALFVFISGIGEMGNTFGKLANVNK